MMISHESKKKFYWDMIVIISAVYISCMIPLEVAYEPQFAHWSRLQNSYVSD